MAKEEPKRFPKITLQLTARQQELLEPFAQKVRSGFVGDGGDYRYAALGQAWFVGAKDGLVDIHLLDAKSYAIINRAIMRARKQIK